MTQMVKCLLSKHEVMSSESQNLCRKAGLLEHNRSTPALGRQRQADPGTYQPGSLAESMSSGVRERETLPQKIK